MKLQTQNHQSDKQVSPKMTVTKNNQDTMNSYLSSKHVTYFKIINIE